MFLIPIIQAEAASNPNLFVSAENSLFDNHFSGSMVVEVVIRDSDLQDTDEGKGEPDVTLNGKSLRMVQSTDGNWYAYFANVDKAKTADSTQSATSGKGLDFGVFCSRDTVSSVFGISLSETDGFAVPRNNGLSGFTNGDVSFNQCTGTPTSSTNLNNVVRNAKSINTNSNIPSGQIGLDSDAWPLIQLFSFDDVTIQYNAGGNPQSVTLEYDESANISMSLDRALYPQNSKVFLSVNDFQLNQDQT
ncbi:MAG: peptidase, partial [Nitrosarchaeum sp.]|nr:peptidase [Nitrosarchaeum sp.]